MDNLLFKDTTGTLEYKEMDDGFVHLKGYASTFGNKDRTGDIVEEQAFSISLTQRMPKLLNQHKADEPLGVIDRAYTNEVGLLVEARMPKDNQMVKDLLPLLKMGAVGDFSIGYSVVDAEMRDDGVRLLKEVELWEVSIVTFPANEKARIMHVKKLAEESKQKEVKDMDDKTVDAMKAESIVTKREFELMLKETGVFTKKATVILASRFKEDKSLGEPEKKPEQSDSVNEDRLLDAINEFKQSLTKKD